MQNRNNCYFCEHCKIHIRRYPTLECMKHNRVIRNWNKDTWFGSKLHGYYKRDDFPKLTYFERYCKKSFQRGRPTFHIPNFRLTKSLAQSFKKDIKKEPKINKPNLFLVNL